MSTHPDPERVGTVAFDDDRTAVVSVDDAGWIVSVPDDPALSDRLARLVRARPPEPWEGEPGPVVLRRIAEALGGTPTLDPGYVWVSRPDEVY